MTPSRRDEGRTTQPSRKRGKTSSGENCSGNRFLDDAATSQFETIRRKTILRERTIILSRDDVCPGLLEQIHSWGWRHFVDKAGSGVEPVVHEFYAHAARSAGEPIWVRGKLVPFDAHTINRYYNLQPIERDDYQYSKGRKRGNLLNMVIDLLCGGRVEWNLNRKRLPMSFPSRAMDTTHRVWLHFIASRIMPCSNMSEVNRERALLIYTISKGQTIDLGQIIHNQILQCAHSKRGTDCLFFPALVTGLCEAAGVEWEDSESMVPPLHPIDDGVVQGVARFGRLAMPASNSDEPPMEEPRRVGGC